MAPPKASPAPRPFATSTGVGWHDDPLTVGSEGEDALGALLDDREGDAAVEQGASGILGSSVPTATRHSSRLPMATVLASIASAAARVASASARQNCGSVVEVDDGVRACGSRSAQAVA